MLNKQITLFIYVFLFSSCSSFLLEEQSKVLQPYRIGDLLIFRNSDNQVDSILIEKVESFVNPTDPLDVFPTRTETIFVTGKISVRKIELDIIGRQITKRSIKLLTLIASENNDYFLFIYSNPNDSLQQPITGLTTAEIEEKLKNNSKRTTISAKSFYENLSGYEYDLLSFDWDKDLGYTKFIYKKSFHIELIDFIREGQSLLN